MKTRALRSTILALLGLLALVPAAMAQNPGPDYVASDNVEHVKHLKEVGDGVGGAVIGDKLFITSTTHLTIFDITDAENPVMQGVFTLNVEWENEEVPTNGKILGISASLGCVPVDPNGITSASDSCLSIYDVSDPENVELLSVVDGAGDHTAACILDCTYFIGDAGTIVDARDPAKATMLEDNWVTNLNDKYAIETRNSCHHIREIKPGIVLGSCNPIVLFSVLPEHGGSVTHPALLALGTPETGTLIHSSRWPREGKDRWVLVGQETNAQPQCTDSVAAFQVWDGKDVRNGLGGFNVGSAMTLVDEFRPSTGTYVDGRNPVNGLGCSVHWFNEHPTFNEGGLVAVAAYEHGTRLLQIAADGRITEQGFFQPLGGSTSSPYWHPNGKVFYNIDYARGVDVIRYTGPDYHVAEGDGTKPPSTTPPTTTPPSEALSLTVGRLAGSVRRGFAVGAACSRTCDLSARLVVDRRTARKLRLGRRAVTVARGSARKASGRKVLRMRVARRYARKLRRGTRASLIVTAKAADGRSATARRTVRVR